MQYNKATVFLKRNAVFKQNWVSVAYHTPVIVSCHTQVIVPFYICLTKLQILFSYIPIIKIG